MDDWKPASIGELQPKQDEIPRPLTYYYFYYYTGLSLPVLSFTASSELQFSYFFRIIDTYFRIDTRGLNINYLVVLLYELIAS